MGHGVYAGGKQFISARERFNHRSSILVGGLWGARCAKTLFSSDDLLERENWANRDGVLEQLVNQSFFCRYNIKKITSPKCSSLVSV